ncbi:hypothetical protein ABT324_30745 [Saccharopolyspora sp. NPDC000359]|uniref:hypothetical protein n=1 Tax=Saccharopolyspora sp. NPDC000359 TaxID=3154251 RepID=UPI00332C9DF5
MTDIIDDLAAIAYPPPRPGTVIPEEAFDDVAEQRAAQRQAYAANLRSLAETTDEDPLLAALGIAAADRDDAERLVRQFMAYARHHTGGTRPGYSWPVLAAAAGLDRKTAERRVDDTARTAVSEALTATAGLRPSWWHGQSWLDTARHHTDDHTPVLLDPAAITLLRELLDAERDRLDPADRDRARLVTDLIATLDAAPESPEQADDRGLSRDATWHPANQLARLLPVALTTLARWAGGDHLATTAVRHAAAIEYDRRGWDGVREVAAAARIAADRTGC